MSQTPKLGEIRQMWRQINVFQRGHWLSRSFTTNRVVFHLPLMWFLPDNWCWGGLAQERPRAGFGERIGGSELLSEEDDGALPVPQQQLIPRRILELL